jgi:hypothetical protein
MSTARVGKPTADSFEFAHVHWARHDLVSRPETRQHGDKWHIFRQICPQGMACASIVVSARTSYRGRLAHVLGVLGRAGTPLGVQQRRRRGALCLVQKRSGRELGTGFGRHPFPCLAFPLPRYCPGPRPALSRCVPFRPDRLPELRAKRREGRGRFDVVLNRLKLEPTVGFEPTTCALRKHCSTTELSRRKEREDTCGRPLVKQKAFC